MSDGNGEATDAGMAPMVEIDASDEILAQHLHRAVCLTKGCAALVTYEPIGAAGFAMLDRSGMEADVSLGVGPNGRPECPHGHGEMALADEQLPAAEAFAAAEDLAPRLPFPVPPFNYEGAMHAIFEKRHAVAALAAIVESKKAKLKVARDEWEESVASLDQMIAEFERNERERIAETDRRALQAESPELPMGETASPADEPIAAEGEPIAAAAETTPTIDETPAPEPAHRYPETKGRGRRKTSEATA